MAELLFVSVAIRRDVPFAFSVLNSVPVLKPLPHLVNFRALRSNDIVAELFQFCVFRFLQVPFAHRDRHLMMFDHLSHKSHLSIFGRLG